MIKKYKNHTIKIYRATTLSGCQDIMYYCFRNIDNVEICSGTGGLLGMCDMYAVYHYIKNRVDEYEK